MEEFHHFFTCFFPVSLERGQAFGHIHGTIPRHFLSFHLKYFFHSLWHLCVQLSLKSGMGVERAPEQRRSLPPGLRPRCWLCRRQAAMTPLPGPFAGADIIRPFKLCMSISPAGEFLLQRCKRNQKTAGGAFPLTGVTLQVSEPPADIATAVSAGDFFLPHAPLVVD